MSLIIIIVPITTPINYMMTTSSYMYTTVSSTPTTPISRPIANDTACTCTGTCIIP